MCALPYLAQPLCRLFASATVLAMTPDAINVGPILDNDSIHTYLQSTALCFLSRSLLPLPIAALLNHGSWAMCMHAVRKSWLIRLWSLLVTLSRPCNLQPPNAVLSSNEIRSIYDVFLFGIGKAYNIATSSAIQLGVAYTVGKAILSPCRPC